MNKTGFVFAFLTLACVTAFAQETSPFNGKWIATYPAANGPEDRKAEVVITDTGGSWRDTIAAAVDRRNPCIGKDFPIVIKSRTATEIAFNVDESAIQGCYLIVISVKVVDGKTLEGKLGKQNRPLKLVRE